MPYVTTTVSTKLDDTKRENLYQMYRALCSESFSVPPEMVMTTFHDETTISFNNTTEPCANISVNLCGDFPEGMPANMTPVITAAVEKECGVKADRIFVMYFSTPHAGWNGKNF